MKNLVKKYNLNSLIERFGIRNVKIVLTAVTVLMAVLFTISVVMAIIAHSEMNTYTTVTM